MRLIRSISKYGCEEGESKAHSAPSFYTWSQEAGSSVEKSPSIQSTPGNQFCFLFILFGNQAGSKYENCAIGWTSVQWVSLLSSEDCAMWKKRQARWRLPLRGQASPEGKQPATPPRSWRAVCVCVSNHRNLQDTAQCWGIGMLIAEGRDNGDESELYKMSLFPTL